MMVRFLGDYCFTLVTECTWLVYDDYVNVDDTTNDEKNCDDDDQMYDERNCVTSLRRDNATQGLGNEYKVRLFTISNREDDDGQNYANDDDDYNDDDDDNNDDDDGDKRSIIKP